MKREGVLFEKYKGEGNEEKRKADKMYWKQLIQEAVCGLSIINQLYAEEVTSLYMQVNERYCETAK